MLESTVVAELQGHPGLLTTTRALLAQCKTQGGSRQNVGDIFDKPLFIEYGVDILFERKSAISSQDEELDGC